MSSLISSQHAKTLSLQAAVAADGNGEVATTKGLRGRKLVEIVNTDTAGTCTVQFQGGFDFTHFYNARYQQIDNVAAPTPAVAAISVTANSRHVYELLDPYDGFRAVISSTAGFVSNGKVTIKLYASAI